MHFILKRDGLDNRVSGDYLSGVLFLWRPCKHIVYLVDHNLCIQAIYFFHSYFNVSFPLTVSDEFGFGLLDADALTENARTWKNSGKQLECKIEHNVKEK